MYLVGFIIRMCHDARSSECQSLNSFLSFSNSRKECVNVIQVLKLHFREFIP